MKTLRVMVPAALLPSMLALATPAAHATSATGATVRCDAGPKEGWGRQMDLQRQLKAEGWKVRQVKTENGCYEVYGWDARGRRVEAFFDPRSFTRVDGGAAEAAAPVASGASAASAAAPHPAPSAP